MLGCSEPLSPNSCTRDPCRVSRQETGDEKEMIEGRELTFRAQLITRARGGMRCMNGHFPRNPHRKFKFRKSQVESGFCVLLLVGWFLETGSFYLTQAGLEPSILLPQPLECWDCRCGLSHQTGFLTFNKPRGDSWGQGQLLGIAWKSLCCNSPVELFAGSSSILDPTFPSLSFFIYKMGQVDAPPLGWGEGWRMH
jgi:hypothetical protein